MWLGIFAAWMNGLLFFSPQWTVGKRPLAGWDTSVYLGYFCNAKGQREIKITLAFVASHEACRRMAVWVGHQTGSYARPASREARCRAAVIPRPTGFPTSSPAPYGAEWGAGVLPLPARAVAERR